MMNKTQRKIIYILSISLLCGLIVSTSVPVNAINTDITVHDPSMIKGKDGCYYAYSTGDGIWIYKSCTLTGDWKFVGWALRSMPFWIYDVIGTSPRDLWAPDINYFNGKYYLYYAGSTFGSNASAIGLATATDPAGPWTDQGEVLHTMRSDNYNAIDPNLAWDLSGRAWLSFGSFWDGIKMREIDPTTGKLLASNSTLYSLASRHGGAIEASSIMQLGGYYYLFVSFDKCCSGVSSTYRIMVGRSKNITGPYVDDNGTDMMNGGALQVLAGYDQFIGPGGEDVMADGPIYQLVYHYYDGNEGGRSKLAVRTITLDGNGWPTLSPME